jgi:hypothetical protein
MVENQLLSGLERAATMEFLPSALFLLLAILLLDFSKEDKTGRLLQAIGWLSLYTGVASLLSHLFFQFVHSYLRTDKQILIMSFSVKTVFIGGAIVYFFFKRRKEWSEFLLRQK